MSHLINIVTSGEKKPRFKAKPNQTNKKTQTGKKNQQTNPK